MTPDLPSILRYARLSALAYGGVQADFTALGLRVVHVINCPATDTQGYVLVGDEEIIVVFRGTSSIRDWLTNIKIRKEYGGWFGSPHAKVHRGFLAAIRSVIGDVRREVHAQRIIREKHLAIIGHSLGGALAKLCAVELEDSYEAVNEVVTFGSPRVGDATFKAYYNSILGDRTIRVVNQIDAVPRAPFWLRGYRQSGLTLLFIDAAKKAEINPDPVTLLFNDAVCLIRDFLHLRWFNIAGFKIPIPWRISGFSNHTMSDYIPHLEELNASH